MVNNFDYYCALLQNIAIDWKLKKALKLGHSLQNQPKKQLEIFVVSCTNISLSLMLILNQEKQKKKYFLMCSNVYDDFANFEVCGFRKNIKIEISWELNEMFSYGKKIH